MLAAVGVALFVGLFWVYASSLQYADLAPVTLGWVVLLQVGVLVLDRYRYDAQLPVGKWVAVGVILAAQAYLLLGAQGSPTASVPAAQALSTSTPVTVDTAKLVIQLPDDDLARTTPTTGAGRPVGPRHRADR